ncbi:MAG: hypothetical protein HQL03_13530 [Nitrospirae bacterium]|nr:hypothetical protein [Nitrospirota bacterium]
MQMILESRVNRLENLMAEVIELHREFTHEMSAMKAEAAERDRKDKEAQAERDLKFEEHIRQEKDERKAFRQEMRVMEARFEEWLKKDKETQQEQARKDKEEREKERKELVAMINKSRADTTKQLGTLVEDIIAPGAPPLIRQYFKCEPDDFRPRTKKRKGHLSCEVDLLLICEDKAFMIEVKSKPDDNDVDDILKNYLPFLKSVLVSK